MRFRYSSEHLEFLRQNFKSCRVPELTSKFNERFGLDKTEQQIKSTLKNHKIRCGRPRGVRKGERLTYTPEQIKFIKEGYREMDKHELTKFFNNHFGTDKGVNQIEAFIDNHKIRSGRTGRFKKGHKSWNNGLAGTGVCKPNSGCFKKGCVPGNTVPMYTERLNKEGFVEIKVPVTNPYTKAKSRFMHKQVWIWEQANGPVPENHVIRFLDGDKTNCAIENLGLFTRAESLEMTRLGFSEAPGETKSTIATLAKLTTKTKRTERSLYGHASPGEIRSKVFELGKAHQNAGLGPFTAHQIQKSGWPEVEGRKTVKLGISFALSVLVRQGKFERVQRGLYAVAESACCDSSPEAV